MKVVRSVQQMVKIASAWRREGVDVAFVPTMGALHEGHLSLVRAAKKSHGRTVVSVFVNPMQFGPHEDFRQYPRNFRKDASLLSRTGVDVIFYPEVSDMFPDGFGTKVSVPGLSESLCGRFRPGHFDGVATVVAKLFAIVRPTAAFFGQKDYQQCKVIERMTQDLNLGVKIRSMPIVREKDGLAMSSRNQYLSAGERARAAGIYRVLGRAREAVQGGQGNAHILQAGARRQLTRQGIRRIDYVQIVDTDTLEPLSKVRSKAVMALAVWIGNTRLIDNMVLMP